MVFHIWLLFSLKLMLQMITSLPLMWIINKWGIFYVYPYRKKQHLISRFFISVIWWFPSPVFEREQDLELIVLPSIALVCLILIFSLCVLYRVGRLGLNSKLGVLKTFQFLDAIVDESLGQSAIVSDFPSISAIIGKSLPFLLSIGSKRE